jgi:hypothetical protein
MAYFHTNVLDPQIKALPTIGTAQGSVASFETDMTEDLIEVVCDIQYSQASGIPTPTNPIPITVYSSLNLSHSGADTSNPTITNIPFGQTVAIGTLDVLSGVLTIEKGASMFDGSSDEVWSAYSAGNGYYINVPEMKSGNNLPSISNSFPQYSGVNAIGLRFGFNNTYAYFYQANTIDNITDLASWKTWLNNNPITIVYDLETTTKEQLNSNQITALLNENNIWHDCNGDTEVKYILSVGKLIS